MIAVNVGQQDRFDLLPVERQGSKIGLQTACIALET